MIVCILKPQERKFFWVTAQNVLLLHCFFIDIVMTVCITNPKMKRFTIFLSLFLMGVVAFPKNETSVLPDSLTIALNQNVKDDKYRCDVLVNVIEYLFDERYYSDAQPYIDELIGLATQMNDNYTMALADFYKGAVDIQLTKLHEAYKYLSYAKMKYLTLQETNRNMQLGIRIHYSLATYYLYKRVSDMEAFNCLNTIVELNNKLNDKQLEYNVNTITMSLYMSLNKYDEAISIGKNTLINGDFDGQSKYSCYFNIAEAYMRKGVNDSAMMYFDTAYINAKTLSEKSHVIFKKGVFYSLDGDNGKAIECYEKCLGEYRDELRADIEIMSMINLGEIYDSIKDFPKAMGYYHDAISKARETEFIDLEKIASEHKCDLLYRTGKYKEYADNILIYQKLNDSLANMREKDNLEYAILKQQFDKMEIEMRHKSEMQVIEHKRLKLVTLSAVSILTMIIILMLMILNRKKILLKNKHIEKEALSLELEIRNKELTSNVVEMMQRNELFDEIVDKLVKISKNADDDNIRNAINMVSKELSKVVEGNFMEEFDVRFRRVNSEFYENLTKKYPNLTTNEIRLCSFVKLNMTTKDISALTGQTPNSIKTARYRLRKKLGIESDDIKSLQQFISSI